MNNFGLLKCYEFTHCDVIRDFNLYVNTGMYQIQNVVHHAHGPSQSGTSIIGYLLVGGWNGARIIQLLITEYGAWRRHLNEHGWGNWTNLG